MEENTEVGEVQCWNLRENKTKTTYGVDRRHPPSPLGYGGQVGE